MGMGWVQLGALMALAVQNSFQNLIVRYSREVPAADGMYIAGTVVLVTEFTKVFISLGMLLPQAGSPSRLGNLIVRELPPEKSLKLLVPSFVYVLQNNLIIYCLSRLDAPVYQVLVQLKLLTTAGFSVVMLGKRLHRIQIYALLLLFTGVCVFYACDSGTKPIPAAAAKAEGSSVMMIEGLVGTLGVACMSGFAGVYFERVMKHGGAPGARSISPHVINLYMSSYGIISASFTLLAKDNAAIRDRGFFAGWNLIVILSVMSGAFGGVITAVVISVLDNIYKNYAVSVAVYLSAFVSVLFMGAQLEPKFFIGSVVVAVSVLLYNDELIKRDGVQKIPSSPVSGGESLQSSPMDKV